jgi:hypothetical protein
VVGSATNNVGDMHQRYMVLVVVLCGDSGLDDLMLNVRKGSHKWG